MWKDWGEWVSAFQVSSKDINYNLMPQNLVYNVMSRMQEEWKEERESDKEGIIKTMVAQRREMSFLSVFYFVFCFFRVVWYSPGIVGSDKILYVVLCFVLEMTADSSNLQDFL